MLKLLPLLTLILLSSCQLTEEQRAARSVRWAKIGQATATVGANLFSIALTAAANAAVAELQNQNERSH